MARKILLALLIAIAFFLLLSYRPFNAQLVAWISSFNNSYSIADSGGNNQPLMDSVKNDENSVELLPNSITLKFRRILKNGEYDQLNRLLDGRLEAVFKDLSKEEQLYRAYEAFEIDQEPYGSLLNDWVEKYPTNYQPYLARGFYYSHMGWQARGGKWASETEEEQFQKMRMFFDRSRSDLQHALALNEKALPAYGKQIALEMADTSSLDEMRKILRQGVAVLPASYMIREKYILALRPRWGGSYKMMSSYARQAEKHIEENPKLSLLFGILLTDIGRSYAQRDAEKAAIESLDKALEFGDRGYAYYLKGSSYIALEQYEDAIDSLNTAISLDPEEASFYKERSRAYQFNKQLDLAYLDLQRSLMLDPTNTYAIRRTRYLSDDFSIRAKERKDKSLFSEAMSDVDVALRLNNSNDYAYYLRARINMHLNNLESSESDLKKAIYLKKDKIGYYRSLDYVLAQSGRFEEVVEYWGQFLSAVPNNAEAYYERGGAKYHMGDYEGALDDAIKARDLGHPSAEKAYQMVKPLVN
ncbi:tetratricopeptide repeat domain protein [gamma proteobacterium HTCC5015]|nr:tetratricopeptide repeat domain protein [gamma proteobacterium HTCC5015]